MNNFPYFCQAFKKLVGLTPLKYKEAAGLRNGKTKSHLRSFQFSYGFF